MASFPAEIAVLDFRHNIEIGFEWDYYKVF